MKSNVEFKVMFMPVDVQLSQPHWWGWLLFLHKIVPETVSKHANDFTVISESKFHLKNSLGGDANVLELDRDDGCTTVCMH